jgi:hypothetical protein
MPRSHTGPRSRRLSERRSQPASVDACAYQAAVIACIRVICGYGCAATPSVAWLHPVRCGAALGITHPHTVGRRNQHRRALRVAPTRPRRALRCTARAHAVRRHYIARIQGQPLNIGVFIDSTYDIGRIENVHFNPW